MKDSENHSFSHGKWAQPGVPQKGWTCTYVEDLGEPLALCEMCETQTIRFVHYMEHPRYPDELGVGCVCAGHMEENYTRAESREKKLKNLSRRRTTWPRKKWRQSAQGNSYLNVEGFNITIFLKSDSNGQYLSFRVLNRKNSKKVCARRKYETLEHAKNATLDALIWAKEKLT